MGMLMGSGRHSYRDADWEALGIPLGTGRDTYTDANGKGEGYL